MKVKNLKLINFRNYTNLDIDFSNGLNYIVGQNAIGKTNLVESIYTLSFGKSFKATTNFEMINKNAKSAFVKAVVEIDERTKTIEIEFKKDGKKVYINSKAISKLSELANVINVLSFVPKDTSLLKDSPRMRRNFLNSTISKMDKDYLKALINLEKLIKERNESLKAYKINFTLIDVLTRQIISLSKIIYLKRVAFINELNKILTNVYQKISLNKERIFVRYKPFIEDEVNYEAIATRLFKENLDNDLKRKTTCIGVQREDFEVYLGDRNLALYGSQGENRMAVISLKIAPYFLTKDSAKKPIIILDDVLSELDKEREVSLINFLSKMNQVFLTNTKKSEFCKENYYICAKNTVVKE